MPCSRTISTVPTGTTLSTTTPRRRSASGSVSCGSWRRPASHLWPLTCHSRPSAGWRSPATSFALYRPPGGTDRPVRQDEKVKDSIACARRNRRASRSRWLSAPFRSNTVNAAVTNQRKLEPVETRIMLAVAIVLVMVGVLVAIFPRLLAYPIAAVAIYTAGALFYRSYRLRREE